MGTSGALANPEHLGSLRREACIAPEATSEPPPAFRKAVGARLAVVLDNREQHADDAHGIVDTPGDEVIGDRWPTSRCVSGWAGLSFDR